MTTIRQWVPVEFAERGPLGITFRESASGGLTKVTRVQTGGAGAQQGVAAGWRVASGVSAFATKLSAVQAAGILVTSALIGATALIGGSLAAAARRSLGSPLDDGRGVPAAAGGLHPRRFRLERRSRPVGAARAAQNQKKVFKITNERILKRYT